MIGMVSRHSSSQSFKPVNTKPMNGSHFSPVTGFTSDLSDDEVVPA